MSTEVKKETPSNEEEVVLAIPDEEESSDSDAQDKKRDALSHQPDKYPMRYVSCTIFGSELSLNPFTSLFGFAFLWGISVWCMATPSEADARLGEWSDAVTAKFTWFYIVANPSFTFFVFWLAYQYGDVKLGKKDDKPEFDDLSYFMMLFSAGVAVGLFFYGVAEPLWHRQSNWYAEAGYHSQDEIDQFALMITMYHWGFAGWSPYIVVAVAAGLAAYRFDLPMTVRSTLYHVLGDHTWGWIGDVIDGFSIVMTVAGVCTSLGLGTIQITAGAKRLGWMDTDLTEDEETNKQVLIIWVITLIATASVVSGLSVGVKLLSQIGFGLGLALLFLCLVMENTKYIFNLTVQTTGYYFQYCIFQIPFWTDAFGQLAPGEGRSEEGAAETWWMGSWTVFYMAWWTAWGAFVGLFLARISRGRTIRQVVIYSFMAPLVYSLIWFCTFGGIGLRQARQAEELETLGETYFNNSAHFRQDGSNFCYNVPQNDLMDPSDSENSIFTNNLKGITPVCQFDTSDATAAWFNVMYSFGFPKEDDEDWAGFGGFMAGLSLVALTIYFVTSSDSGSLIVDHLASNGHEDHHWLQRVFWAFTEGAVATALLVAGGSQALSALQAASLVFGLPFNFFLFAMMYATVGMCQTYREQEEAGNHNGKLPRPEDTGFKMHLFGGMADICEYIVSLGSPHPDRVAAGLHMPDSIQVKEFFIGLFIPSYSVYRICERLELSKFTKYSLTLLHFALFVMWIVFAALAGEIFAYVAFSFLCFFLNAVIVVYLRLQVRELFNVEGNVVGDFIAGSFLYMQGMCQMMYEFERNSVDTAAEAEVAGLVEPSVKKNEVEA